MKPTFTISPDGQSITCHKCGKTSYNLNDVKEKYCGFCHDWHPNPENPDPLPWSVCPVCGYRFDDATCIVKDEAKPRPGDLSLCLKCGEILVFDQELRCKQAGIDDFDGLPGDIERKMMMAQAMIRKERPIK